MRAIILVPVETALGLTANPGELVGDGPLTARHASELRCGRIVAVDDQVQRLTPAGPSLAATLLAMVDRPATVEARDDNRHDPTAGLTWFVQLRDPRCAGPGCSVSARQCNIDHLIANPTGPTNASNRGPVSRRCHNAKTYGGLTLTPHPDGSVTWTSPLGRPTTRPNRTEPADLSNLRPTSPPQRPQHDQPADDGDQPPPF